MSRTDDRVTSWIFRAILGIPVGYLIYGLWLAEWHDYGRVFGLAALWLAGALALGVALERFFGQAG